MQRRGVGLPGKGAGQGAGAHARARQSQKQCQRGGPPEKIVRARCAIPSSSLRPSLQVTAAASRRSAAAKGAPSVSKGRHQCPIVFCANQCFFFCANA